jgi:hypothetical protein
MSEFKGVTARCSAALKQFGLAVLKVYLGQDWTSEDERRVQDALGTGKDGRQDKGK